VFPELRSKGTPIGPLQGDVFRGVNPTPDLGQFITQLPSLALKVEIAGLSNVLQVEKVLLERGLKV